MSTPAASLPLAADTAAAYEHNGKRISAEAFYAIACDPRRHVAVQACAGAGKTWMLVSRIVRALLAGAQPHEILAITFTKKAAGEMRQRLHDSLAEYAQHTSEQLLQALLGMGFGPQEAISLQVPLQNLYRNVLDAGRPVQLRTFHGWFAALLRNAPLAVLQALGLPANYELLEDDAQAVAQVWRRFYAAVLAQPQAHTDFAELVAEHGRSNTHKALGAALARRGEFALADGRGVAINSMARFGSVFPEFAALSDPALALDADSSLTDLRHAWLEAARALGRASAPTFATKGAELEAALSSGNTHAALAALLSKEGQPRKFSEKLVGLAAVRAAQDRALRLQAACEQHQAWLHQQRMTHLTRLLIAEFKALKQQQGWIDMNDVERAGQVLLADPVASGWVQERLDARVKHLLIDEFQDTNPLQWQALSAWLGSYTGAGGAAPSVFIVGDPKQSIYRFRRAEPQVFKAAQHFVSTGLQGDLLACNHTRRCAPQVVGVVNAVLGQAQAAGEYEGFRPHTTASARTGSVARLPMIARPAPQPRRRASDPPPELVWRNSLTTPRLLPEDSLRQQESRQAARWVADQLARGIAAKEIIVLARKRDRLATMHEALRELHIDAWQPEKSALADAPEVQDLLALLDVLVSPAHDLSLARALRSPLFGLDDAALVQLALQLKNGRQAAADVQASQPAPPDNWFDWLQQPVWAEGKFATVASSLLQWQHWVRHLPPHDALQAIYDDGDVLARYAAAAPAALRASVLANLRALLGAALQVHGGRFATPYALVRALKSGHSGLKAPARAEVNAVRLLTIHGAKGLEADAVLLLDADGPPPKASTMSVLIDWPGEEATPKRFVFLAAEKTPPASIQEALTQEQAARAQEELNALYVALTRARAHLVFSSVEPAKNQQAQGRSAWQRLHAAHAVSPGWLGEITPNPPAAAPALPGSAPPEAIWLKVLPAAPPQAALAVADEAKPAAQQQTNLTSAAIGKAMHRLLERTQVAGLHQQGLAAVAQEFGLSQAQALQAQQMAQRIQSGQAAWAWDAAQIDWQGNEVALACAGEGGRTLALRLDRLVRHKASGEWWVLDYKSALQPGQQAQLRAQLRQYRAAVKTAVQAAQPDAVVRAALLASDGTVTELD